MACAVAQQPRPALGAIPDDLVPVILELNEHRWWPCDFQRLALVSPAWLGPVRRRLYAFPSVSTYRACELLARTLRTNPRLLTLLRGIDLRPLDGTPSAAELASLRYLLGLHGLPILVLAGACAIRAERFLHALARPHAVTELHVDGNQLAWEHGELAVYRPASLTWDAALASAFPNLEKLRLSNVELDVPRPATPHGIRPTDLILDNVVVTGRVIDLADFSDLRRLNVTCQEAGDLDEHLPDLFAACAETLVSLYYEVQSVRRDDAVILDHFPACPAMRQLTLSGVNLVPASLTAIADRCQGLEDLTVQGRAVQVTSTEWASFIHSGALPRLRALDTPFGTYAPPFKYWTMAMNGEVVSACAARNIRLACHLIRAY